MPFYVAHSTEPLLQFDSTEATFMLSEISHCLSTIKWIAIEAHQLAKSDEELDLMQKQIIHMSYLRLLLCPSYDPYSKILKTQSKPCTSLPILALF